MEDTIEKKSYYREYLPQLIKRLKNSIEKIEKIIDQDIDDELADDKLFNVLKAKRQASEDVIWTLKRIDELESELNGTEDTNDTKPVAGPVSHAKKFARKTEKPIE